MTEDWKTRMTGSTYISTFHYSIFKYGFRKGGELKKVDRMGEFL